MKEESANINDNYVIEVLHKSRHDRKPFDCGVEPLNLYLKTRASQDQKARVAEPFVLTCGGTGSVLGYYTLSACSIPLDKLPARLAKRTRYEVVPAALIGRLAVDSGLRGEGFGKHLLIDALRRIANLEVAVMVVLVDPKDRSAADFYARFGFVPLEDPGGRMFLHIDTVRAL